MNFVRSQAASDLGCNFGKFVDFVLIVQNKTYKQENGIFIS